MLRHASVLQSLPAGAQEASVASTDINTDNSRVAVTQDVLQAPNHEQITAVDLFAGAGGFSLAAHNAGINILSAVEYNNHACATYRNNLVERMGLKTRLYNEDINKLTPEQLLDEVPALVNGCDLVIGGPPCQGFSSHRFKDKGVGDPRNELLIRYFEFVEALQPTAFLVENVPGFLWKRHEDYLARFREAAANAGYRLFEPVVLNASDYGVPQRRRRVFILGIRAESNFEITWPPKPTHSKLISNTKKSEERPAWLSASEVFNKPLNSSDSNAVHMNHSEKMIERFRNTPANGGSRSDSGVILPCHEGHSGHKDVYGRIDPSKPGPTMTTACINPSKGRFIHPTEHHGITLRHAARFQTFPDDFVFSGGLIAGGVQIGNAVPVQMGKCLLSHTADAISGNRGK